MADNKKVFRVTCKAPVNIAVIKYWGKSDEKLILPLNSSLSVTLHQDDLCTTTTVAVCDSFESDKIWLNGVEEDINSVRLQNCLTEIRRIASTHSSRYKQHELSSLKVHICSKNNFPTAAGLASSASGFACLVYTLARAFGIEGHDISELARRGSGSACRSVYGGFVEWQKGDSNGTGSKAIQVAPDSHWSDMNVLILVVSDNKKAVSSSKGMQLTVETSSLIKNRADEIVPQRMSEMRDAIKRRDFETFGVLTMKDSNQFHAVCLDTYPPIFYLNDTSKYIINLITSYNQYKGHVVAAYSFDAGPNAVLFAPKQNMPELISLVLHYLPSSNYSGDYLRGSSGYSNGTADPLDEEIVRSIGMNPLMNSLRYILCTRVGPGPSVVAVGNEGDTTHLVDTKGIPIVDRSN